MAPNRKRHAVSAARDRWLLLGELLQARRQELGYRHRPAFARDRLPLTDAGNPNVRLVADAEMGYRDTFPPGTLREIARAYDVAYESVTAVLAGKADELDPARRSALPDPPFDDLPRRDADAPYAAPIFERLADLQQRGVTDPAGAQLFPPGSDDARDWDRFAGRLPRLSARVWMIAELHRLEEASGRGNGSRSGTA